MVLSHSSQNNTLNATPCNIPGNVIADEYASLLCPLCQSKQTRILVELRGKRLASCDDCGSAHILPQPSPAELAAHFEGAPALDEKQWKEKFETNRRRVLAKVAAFIQKEYASGGNILDVGCATGLFLREFFKTPQWNSEGVELSPDAADIARINGVRVFRGQLREAGFTEEAFNAVTILDAFYYFADPGRELREVHRILRCGGMLLIELPLATSRLWRISSPVGKMLSGSRGSVFETSDHLFYYTPRSTSALLQRNGFAVHAIVPLPANQQPSLAKDAMFSIYSQAAIALWRLSRGCCCLAPRYLVAARKAHTY